VVVQGVRLLCPMVDTNRSIRHLHNSVAVDVVAAGLGENAIENFVNTVGNFVSKLADILL